MIRTYINKNERDLPELENDKSKTDSSQINNMLYNPSILTGLSHEVRTYMNSIVAFSFLMNNDSCDQQERKEYNDHIMNSCEQLLTLFDNFLDSALIDTDKPKTILTKCRLKTVLQELIIELNSSLDRFDKKFVTLVLDERSDDSEMFIDKEKVIRVIKNLFYNALENTESGYIKLGYKMKDKRVVFYVIDSGDAYNKNKELLTCENLSSYLEKYNNTFTTVGLILAQLLIQSMHGEIWLETNSINGSAMYFSLPEMKVMDPGKFRSELITTRIAI